jgi:L-ascorbate metabolism protein UlaG (beta-lactamase superfamily)
MERSSVSEEQLIWLGGAGVALHSREGSLFIDPPFIDPQIPAPDIVCITHVDHDHFNERTIERLAQDDRLKNVLVPPSCVDVNVLDVPVLGAHRGLSYLTEDRVTVVRPGLVRRTEDRYEGPTGLVSCGFEISTIDSSERPERYRTDSAKPPLWPEGRGAFVGHNKYPSVGYIVTMTASGTTFYHPGDLHEQFNSHRGLTGKIDFFFMPLPKFIGQERSLLELLRPRYVVPIHYDVDDCGVDDLEGIDMDIPSWEGFRRNHLARMGARWFPSPKNPVPYMAELEGICESVGSRLLRLDAEQPVRLADYERKGRL